MDINSINDKEFKVIVMKMLTELCRRMGKHSDHLDYIYIYIYINQTEVLTELKNTLEAFNSRLDGAEG